MTYEPARALDWTGDGYFYDPIAKARQFSHMPENWRRMHAAIEAAKSGDFRPATGLFGFFDRRAFVIERICAQALGDFAPTDFMSTTWEFFDRVDEDRMALAADVLIGIGQLKAVPTLLELFNFFDERDTALEIKEGIIRLLYPLNVQDEVFHRHADPDDFLDEAEKLNHAQIALHGSDEISVLYGEPLDLRHVYDSLRERLSAGGVHRDEAMEIRRKVEAMSGVNCSAFFRGNVFDPLQAIAGLEAILERPEVQGFRPGQRYFFGHPVPGQSIGGT